MIIAAPAAAEAQWLDMLGLGKKNSRVAEGLKEALRVGTDNAVLSTGREGGYFKNELIKILLPEPIRKAETAMRLAGLGSKLDELVVGMNRAAETAAPYAKDIFRDAILQMTFADAARILKGHDTAATDYFRDKTTPRLTELFRPPVTKVMGSLGVTQQWNQLFAQAARIPFLKLDGLDLEGYVVDRALFGLFTVIGQEETKIRRDPAARVTSILKDVFGRR
jgi:hypothetical protein